MGEQAAKAIVTHRQAASRAEVFRRSRGRMVESTDGN
jgi:hypothetical protein